MKQSFWNKKIPSLLGITIILSGIFITTFLVKGGSMFQILAGPENDPKKIQITNISDSAFTVTYLTDANVIGTISFGKDQNLLDQTVLDDRDQLTQTINEYQSHSITVNNLEPNSKYYFTITSGADTFSNNNLPYSVTTGPIITDPPTTQNPLNGKVLNPDGSSPTDGLVMVNIDGAQITSTYLKTDGSYTLPLNNLRTDDLTKYFELNPETIINIEVKSANLASSISVSPDQLSPVPIITLSNNYDFSTIEEDASESGNLKNEKYPEINSKTRIQEIQILTPENGEKFTDDQPRFNGTSAPNEEVEIEIHSDENLKAIVIADANGRWSYRPTNALSVGNHTITITSKTTNGLVKKITESFTVLAAGSQVNASATPSGTLTPTRIPTNTPTPTKVVQITPTPTIAPALGISTESDPEISVAPTIPPTGTPFAIIAGIGILFASILGASLFLLIHQRKSI